MVILWKEERGSCVGGSQIVGKVCFFKKVLVLNPYPQTPFPRKGAILLGLPPLVPVGGFAPKQGRFSCLPKVISKDAYVSWTEPLHDATAQTADFAEMQNQQSKQHSTPLFYSQELFRQTDNLSLIQRNCLGDCLRIVLQKWKMLKILLKRIEKSREICYINCIWELTVSPKN